MKNLAFLGTLLVLGGGLFIQACTTRDIVEVTVGSVEVNPQSTSILEGDSLQFTALVYDDDGDLIENAEVEWSSTDPTKLTIRQDGWAHALVSGTVQVVASFHGVPGQAAVTILAVAGFSVSVTGPNTTVSEAGTRDSLMVVLSAQPIDSVVFDVSSADEGEATVSPARLTFTNASWNVPQAVEVIGADDGALVDGPQSTLVTVAINQAGTHAAFDGLASQQQSVTTTDNDGPGFTVTHTGGNTTVSETGTVDSLVVVLTAQPLGQVVFDVSSANTGEALVSPAQLTFTNANWNSPQPVEVTGVDDGLVVDGGRITAVTVAVNAAGTDDAFAVVAPQSRNVTTTDNDLAGFTLTPTNATTEVTEAESRDSLAVVLTAQPVSNVVFNVSTNDTGETMVTPAQLTFTNADWNQVQYITVIGVDDFLIDGDQNSTVTVAVNDVLSDNAFDGQSAQASVTTTSDDAAGFTLADTASTVSEAGSTDPFTIVLDARPVSNVVLNITSSDTGESQVDPATVTFTPAGWNVPKQVAIRGVNDFLIDGTQPSTVSVSVADGPSDDDWDPVADQTVSVQTTDDDSAGLTIVELGGTTVTEAGSSDDFTVALTAQPVTSVVVAITSQDVGEATVSVDSLTFDPTGPQAWNVPRTVTVTGVNDDVVDGDQLTTLDIVVDPSRSDDDFDALSATVVVTTRDGDGVGFLITEVNSTVVSETGIFDEFDVRLTSQPPLGTEVVLSVTSADTGEATVATLSGPVDSLTFTSTNWNQAQTVRVTGVDDVIVDSNIVTAVTVAVDAARSHSSFGTVPPQVVNVTTLDDDVAAFTLGSTAGKTVAEPGTTDAFTVILDRQPLTNVVLAVTLSDGTEVASDSATVTFTPANWNTVKTVPLQAVDDPTVDGTVGSTVALAISVGSSDPLWSVVGSQAFGITTTDDDVPGFTITESGPGTTVTEASGPNNTDTFTIVLDRQPLTSVVLDVVSVNAGEVTVDNPVLTFASGVWNVPQTVTVRGVDEPVDDGDRLTTITVSVSDASSDNAWDALADQTLVATTVDDDEAMLSIGDVTVAEGDAGTANAEFTVSLSVASSQTLTVDYATSDVSATAGADYVAAAGSLSFAPGVTSQSVNVTVNGDLLDEIDETFTVMLSSPINATILDDTATGTINDDDTAGFVLSHTNGSTVATEGGATDSMTVVLTGQPQSGVVFAVTSASVVHALATPTTLAFTSLDWNSPQPITVTAVVEGDSNPSENTLITVSVNDSQSDDSFDSLPDQSLTATTLDPG